MNSDIVAASKRTVLGRKHVVRDINREYLSTVLAGCEPENKYSITNQPTNQKKSQNPNISAIWGEASAEWIAMKISTGDVDRGHNGRRVQI